MEVVMLGVFIPLANIDTISGEEIISGLPSWWTCCKQRRRPL